MSTATKTSDTKRIQIIINGLGSELEAVVEDIAASKGDRLLSSAPSLEAAMRDEVEMLPNAISPTARRGTLMRIAANIGLLIVLDEQRRGSRTIEREMEAFHAGAAKLKAVPE